MTARRETAKQKENGKAPHIKQPIDIGPSACPKCGSQKRIPYHSISRKQINTQLTVIWRVTRCTDCGQARTDLYDSTGGQETLRTGRPPSRGAGKKRKRA